MTIGTTEHYDMMAAFEKFMRKSAIRSRFDKEEKTEWRKGRVYQCMLTNDFFKAYSGGYALARCVYMSDATV